MLLLLSTRGPLGQMRGPQYFKHLGRTCEDDTAVPKDRLFNRRTFGSCLRRADELLLRQDRLHWTAKTRGQSPKMLHRSPERVATAKDVYQDPPIITWALELVQDTPGRSPLCLASPDCHSHLELVREAVVLSILMPCTSVCFPSIPRHVVGKHRCLIRAKRSKVASIVRSIFVVWSPTW